MSNNEQIARLYGERDALIALKRSVFKQIKAINEKLDRINAVQRDQVRNNNNGIQSK